MRILHVIHGYPMRYNAGSEVYTQTLCPTPSPSVTRSTSSPARKIRSRRTTAPCRRDPTIRGSPPPREHARAAATATATRGSTSASPSCWTISPRRGPRRPPQPSVHLAARSGGRARQIPIVFTLHDYWLMCPRGQFMQMHPGGPERPVGGVRGPGDQKCAERCYARYFSGAPERAGEDVAYWTDWVRRRMAHIRGAWPDVSTCSSPPRATCSSASATTSASPRPSSCT